MRASMFKVPEDHLEHYSNQLGQDYQRAHSPLTSNNVSKIEFQYDMHTGNKFTESSKKHVTTQNMGGTPARQDYDYIHNQEILPAFKVNEDGLPEFLQICSNGAAVNREYEMTLSQEEFRQVIGKRQAEADPSLNFQIDDEEFTITTLEANARVNSQVLTRHRQLVRGEILTNDRSSRFESRPPSS